MKMNNFPAAQPIHQLKLIHWSWAVILFSPIHWLDKPENYVYSISKKTYLQGQILTTSKKY